MTRAPTHFSWRCRFRGRGRWPSTQGDSIGFIMGRQR